MAISHDEYDLRDHLGNREDVSVTFFPLSVINRVTEASSQCFFSVIRDQLGNREALSVPLFRLS